MNSKKLRAAALAAALSGTVLVSSCQQFFTNSLAKVLARDSGSYDLTTITVDTAVDMLATAMSSGDAAMATALVTPLLAAVQDADPASSAYQEAASALLDAAILSSGIGPAMTEAATMFLSVDLENITEEDMTAAMDTFSTITLGDDAEAGLMLIATNPPDDMSADDAYSAAIALAADTFTDQNLDINDIASLTPEQTDALSADPAMAAALDLLSLADSLGGSESLFGSLLGDFDLSSFEP